MFITPYHREVIIDLSRRDIQYITLALFNRLTSLREQAETSPNDRIVAKTQTIINILHAIEFMMDSMPDVFPHDAIIEDDPLSGTELHHTTLWLTEYQICTIVDCLRTHMHKYDHVQVDSHQIDLGPELLMHLTNGQSLFDRFYPYYIQSHPETEDY